MCILHFGIMCCVWTLKGDCILWYFYWNLSLWLQWYSNHWDSWKKHTVMWRLHGLHSSITVATLLFIVTKIVEIDFSSALRQLRFIYFINWWTTDSTLTGWLSPRFTWRMRRSLRMSLRCLMGVPALCFVKGSSTFPKTYHSTVCKESHVR